jgi:hypothetical protein
MGPTPEERHRMIAEEAYYRAQRRGFHGGDPLQDWLAAEAEIERRLGRRNAGSAPGNGFVEQLESRLEHWDAEIERLMARAREAQAELRAEIEEEMRRLQPMREAAEQKLTELRRLSGAALQDIRQGADIAWEELSDALKSLTGRRK